MTQKNPSSVNPTEILEFYPTFNSSDHVNTFEILNNSYSYNSNFVLHVLKGISRT